MKFLELALAFVVAIARGFVAAVPLLGVEGTPVILLIFVAVLQAVALVPSVGIGQCTPAIPLDTVGRQLVGCGMHGVFWGWWWVVWWLRGPHAWPRCA